MIIKNFKELEQFKNVPAIYKFRFLTNHNKQYCGEGDDLYDRLVKGYTQEIKNYLNDKIHRPVIGAIIKYKWENIEIEIIDYGEHLRDKKIRLLLETECIIHFNTLIQNGKGYNVILTGLNRTGLKHTQETINKLKGQKRSLEQIKRNTNAQKKMYENGYVNPRKGKTNSKEHCKKISITSKQNNSHKGKNNSQFNHTIYKFKNRITNEIFEGTQYDFYTKNNISPSDVCAVLKNKQKSVKNWILIPNTNQS